jgi:hypothetical protein
MKLSTKDNILDEIISATRDNHLWNNCSEYAHIAGGLTPYEAKAKLQALIEQQVLIGRLAEVNDVPFEGLSITADHIIDRVCELDRQITTLKAQLKIMLGVTKL